MPRIILTSEISTLTCVKIREKEEGWKNGMGEEWNGVKNLSANNQRDPNNI